MTSSCTSSSSSNFFPACLDSGVWWKPPCFISSHNGAQKLISFMCVHLLLWEIVWQNAPRFWWDFGSALPFQTHLTQTKPVLPLSNEHGSQVKDQGRRQCCHNKHNKISLSVYTWCIFTFRTRLVNKHIWYILLHYMQNDFTYFLNLHKATFVFIYWQLVTQNVTDLPFTVPL